MQDQKDIEFYGIRRRTEDEPAYFDAKHISVRDLVQLCRSEITASVSSFICATTRRGGMENCREVAQASTERLVSRQKERPYDFSPLETIVIRRETSMIASPPPHLRLQREQISVKPLRTYANPRDRREKETTKADANGAFEWLDLQKHLHDGSIQINGTFTLRNIRRGQRKLQNDNNVFAPIATASEYLYVWETVSTNIDRYIKKKWKKEKEEKDVRMCVHTT